MTTSASAALAPIKVIHTSFDKLTRIAFPLRGSRRNLSIATYRFA